MKATAVADLHAGGRRVFFDIAAERLLADRQIGGGALQVEPGARLAKLDEFSRIKLFADNGSGLARKLL